MRIVQAVCNIFVDIRPFAWRTDWAWRLLLIVLTVLMNVAWTCDVQTAQWASSLLIFAD